MSSKARQGQDRELIAIFAPKLGERKAKGRAATSDLNGKAIEDGQRSRADECGIIQLGG
jgi:hypothetical protein